MYIIPTDLPILPTYMITYLDFNPESKACFGGNMYWRRLDYELRYGDGDGSGFWNRVR